MRRLVTFLPLVVAAAVGLVVMLSRGAGPYVIRVKLSDGAGLRQNSPVMIGGVQAGTVKLHLGRGNQVIAELDVDRSQAPVGRDASVAISAVNFLGQKEAELTRGTVADPAPSGYQIPSSNVTVSTDLDQVLDVLDAGTRARLAILIDEAGTALTGRRQDFGAMMEQLAPSVAAGRAILSRLVGDTHTLAHLVTTSDRFVTQVNSQRGQLARLINTAGQAALSVAARRGQLAQTLSRAPRTLATLQAFLTKLQATTAPLGPAASNLTATAPAAEQALAQVAPFVAAARPMFDTATRVAPELTHLAAGATPVLAQANPTLASLASFSSALRPISRTLDRSVDNILAVVDNWSRAIQFRDGLSHVFRGEASITPDVLQSLVNRLLGGAAKRSAPLARRTSPAAPAAAPVHRTTPTPAGSAPLHRAPLRSRVTAVVNGLVTRILNGSPGSAPAQQTPAAGSSLSSLLQYLIGR
jgi:phospholipid/cholesterol/gamma-HCH transport system substrate-binding protein